MFEELIFMLRDIVISLDKDKWILKYNRYNIFAVTSTYQALGVGSTSSSTSLSAKSQILPFM